MAKLTLISVCTLAFIITGCANSKFENYSTYNNQPVVSDYALLIMLANRAETQDSQMMNLFARRSYYINNQTPELYYLPQGQENPINFISFNPNFKPSFLPEYNGQTLTPLINIKGPISKL